MERLFYMFILLFGFISVLAITMPFVLHGAGIYDKTKDENVKKKYLLRSGIWVISLIVLIIAISITPFIMERHIIDEAKQVATFADTSMYYDENADTYFAVKINVWDVAKMKEKVIIPKETAIEKLDKLKTITQYQGEKVYLWE